jgi:hypothetical protein
MCSSSRRNSSGRQFVLRALTMLEELVSVIPRFARGSPVLRGTSTHLGGVHLSDAPSTGSQLAPSDNVKCPRHLGVCCIIIQFEVCVGRRWVARRASGGPHAGVATWQSQAPKLASYDPGSRRARSYSTAREDDRHMPCSSDTLLGGR